MAKVLENIGDSQIVKIDPNAGKEINIVLDWRSGGGFWHRLFGTNPIDLDLGCYYELQDGKKMLIDSLQFAPDQGGPKDTVTKQGCLTAPPYIWHSGDDQGLRHHARESLLVNAKQIGNLRRMLVYAYIYEGPTNWDYTRAFVAICVPGAEPVVVKIDHPLPEKRFCMVAALNFLEEGQIEVKKLQSFYSGHSDCDHAYGWGFKYRDSKQ